MTFKQRMNKAKGGIPHLMKVLDNPPSFGTGEEKTKNALNARKNAFISASALVLNVYKWEDAEGVEKDVKWYLGTIKTLIEKGNGVVDTMFDGIASSINSESDEALSGDIAAKKEAPINVDLINQELEKLQEIIKTNKDGKSKEFAINKESISYNMKHAE